MKVFMAGCDTVDAINTVVAGGHHYCLSSYYTAIKGSGGRRIVKEIQHRIQQGDDWIMDSGLFSMMFGAGSNELRSQTELTEYTERYISDLEQIGYTGTVVEMDVHKVLGLDALKTFREIFHRRVSIDRTIFVWHREEGEAGWLELVKRYPYVALSIPELRILCGRSADQLKPVIALKIRAARQINPRVKIHLLGCTDPKLLDQPGWYSADSTSWLYAGMHACGQIWDGRRFAPITIHDPRFQAEVKRHMRTVMARRPTFFARMGASRRNYVLSNATCVVAYSAYNHHLRQKYQ